MEESELETIVYPAELRIIWRKECKLPSVVLIFKENTIEKIKKNQPTIEGINTKLLKFLRDHKDPQKWDFINWDGNLALLIPKTYAILSCVGMWSIYLRFKEKKQSEE